MRPVTAGRRGWIAIGIAAARRRLAAVALLLRLGAPAQALRLPGSSRRRPPRASSIATTASSCSSSAVAWPSSTATTTGGRTSTSQADEEPAALFRNDSEVGGALAFTPLPGAATDLDQVTGAYPLDIDGDGIDDLAVLRLGENVLLRGRGDCAFERANEAWGYDGGDAWTAAFSATWESPDGLPTLAFGNYLVPDSVDDGTYVCDEHDLVRPAADGATYEAPTELTPGWCTLSMLFSDWDRSGRRDLRVSNDRHYHPLAQEQLWRVEPGAGAAPLDAEEGWQPVRIWGMGIASQRPHRRRLPGGLPHQPGRQQAPDPCRRSRAAHLQGHRDPEQRERAAGRTPATWISSRRRGTRSSRMRTTTASPTSSCPRATWRRSADFAARDPNNLLIGQPDGTFVEGAMDAGIVSFARGRGAGLADLNLDGMLDLVVVNRRENVSLWRNVGAGTPDAPEPHGQLGGARPGGPWREPRRDRRVGRGRRSVTGSSDAR